MKYTLVNPNYTYDYIKNLIEFRGGSLSEMESCSLSDALEPPEHLDNIEEGAELLLYAIEQNNKKICLIVD